MSGRGYGAEPARPGGLAGPGEERDRAPHADHCGRQRKIGPLTGAGGGYALHSLGLVGWRREAGLDEFGVLEWEKRRAEERPAARCKNSLRGSSIARPSIFRRLS